MPPTGKTASINPGYALRFPCAHKIDNTAPPTQPEARAGIVDSFMTSGNELDATKKIQIAPPLADLDMTSVAPSQQRLVACQRGGTGPKLS